MKLELHSKLEFHKLELLKSSRSLIISQIVINPYIFSQTMVFGHFGLKFLVDSIASRGCLVKWKEFRGNHKLDWVKLHI